MWNRGKRDEREDTPMSVTREPVMAARLSFRLIQPRSRPFRRDRVSGAAHERTAHERG